MTKLNEKDLKKISDLIDRMNSEMDPLFQSLNEIDDFPDLDPIPSILDGISDSLLGLNSEIEASQERIQLLIGKKHIEKWNSQFVKGTGIHPDPHDGFSQFIDDPDPSTPLPRFED